MALPIRGFVREYNRYMILSTIRRHGLISRIDISRETGLSQASITGITKELIKEGLIVEEKSGSYKGGRRPILLALNPDGCHVLGVNIELHKINVAVINFQAEVKSFCSMKLEERLFSPEELGEKTKEAIQACVWESGYSKEKISGVGIGIPALVDSVEGIVRYLPMYDWIDVDFRMF